MRTFFVALALLVASCSAPVRGSPEPTQRSAATPAATATSRATTASMAPIAAPVAPEIVMSDAPISVSGTAMLLFQLVGDDRLRAITWDGSRNGVAAARISKPWTQSPDGSRYAVDGMIYDATGRTIGASPWGSAPFTWSASGDLLCAAAPLKGMTGSPMTLMTASPGAGVNVLAIGFATFADNAGYPVLACDPERDRAIVGVFGQGLFAGRIFVLRLSTGEVIRSTVVGDGMAASWLAATPDATLVVHSTRAAMTSVATSSIERAEDGVVLATLPGFDGWGFSGDGSMVYGFLGEGHGRFEVIEWRTRRVIWLADGYQSAGFHSDPRGASVAVPTAVIGLDESRIYLVAPDGTARMILHVNGSRGL